MGEVIHIDRYRVRNERDRQIVRAGAIPPIMVFRYQERGVVREVRVLSERMLRDLLDFLE